MQKKTDLHQRVSLHKWLRLKAGKGTCGAVTVFMWGRGWSLAFSYFQSLVCDKHRILLQQEKAS